MEMEAAMKRSADQKAAILYAFGLSLLFVAIDAAVFALLAGPLEQWIPIRPIWLHNVVHTVLLGTVGTLIGCTAFLANKSRPKLVPLGYSFFPLYMTLCLAYAHFQLEGDTRLLALRLICLYTLAPTAMGLAISWSFYGCLRHPAAN